MANGTPNPPIQLTKDIRESFLGYFEKQGHTRVTSSSLVPNNDPTLLFVNAGMVQFKDCFLGLDKRPYTRAVSSQKCVRAGGKHNDLENVGFTARHHTFFEMLGNFSFGDYFKKDAIHFAWEFVTKTLGLPKNRLRVSVFETDDEAAEIWHKQEGVPTDRIVRFGEKDNFWQMGDTGPCGPCSEIFWDQGKDVDGDRWLEFWNCVFMQYDRGVDGKLTPLPKPSVDTGMGLERMAAILQGVPSNYDIDLFQNLMSKTAEHITRQTGSKFFYEPGVEKWEYSALKVIVDHLRSTSFLIADGVLPSNEGRGYVLRRILRRAVRFGKRLGLEEPFLCSMFEELQNAMGPVYPELVARKSVIVEVLKQEELRFFETLTRGLHILDEAMTSLGPSKIIPAQIAFKLYDTYGFPLDLTALIAREKNLAVDEAGFAKLMQSQQDQSRKSWKGSGELAAPAEVKNWKQLGVLPEFVGYQKNQVEKAKVLAVHSIGDMKWMSISPCPFYGEGGGQVGDVGIIKWEQKEFEVVDTQKPYEGGIAILVKSSLESFPAVGYFVTAEVNSVHRQEVRAHHTATHLLHAALRKVLGTHVAQAGSLVTPEKLRFDFSHPKSLSTEDIQEIENFVNAAIQKDISLVAAETSFETATKKMGALALFSEKYGDKVRVIDVPGCSTELCGGTHVDRTSQIRFFKILSESAVAAGTRRIEAVAGKSALGNLTSSEALLRKISGLLKVPLPQMEDRVNKLLSQNQELVAEVEKLKRKIVMAGTATGSSESKARKTNFKDRVLWAHVLEGSDPAIMREFADSARKNHPNDVHVVLSGTLVLVSLDPSSTKGLHAGDILKALMKDFGGRGGGQAQTAQGQIPGKTITPEEVIKWSENQK